MVLSGRLAVFWLGALWRGLVGTNRYRMDDTDDLGPAMRKLDPRRRAFVRALVGQTYPNQALAAEIAGFSPIETSRAKDRSLVLRVKGSVLAHEERVIAAIQEVAGKELRGTALVAVRALQRMVVDPTTKGHRAAVESVLDRIGMGAEQKINVKHEHTDLTGQAMAERIRELAVKHGLDPAKLLGAGGPPVLELKAEEVPDVG